MITQLQPRCTAYDKFDISIEMDTTVLIPSIRWTDAFRNFLQVETGPLN